MKRSSNSRKTASRNLQLKNGDRLLELVERTWLPPPDLTVSRWADKERRLSSESSAEPGQWDTNRAPYQRGMMDVVNEPLVEVFVLMTSSQVGKTEILNNIIGYYIAHDPSPILNVQPTVKMAEDWSKDRLVPMLDDSPGLREKVSKKSRDSQNTILHKVFPGGHITIVGSNSSASLASRPIRVILFDEVDRYPPSAGGEGDPVKLGKKRTRTFWNRKIGLASTPTTSDSRIAAEFELSDKRFYYVPCPHCGEMQTLKWANIVFEHEGHHVDGDVVYACVNGCIIEEHHKTWMLENGEWIATAKFTNRAGFWINELYSPWSTWREMAIDFLESKDTKETLQTFVNTALAEVFEDTGDGVDPDSLMTRCEAYDKDDLPDEIYVITAAVDVQGDRLEALTQGWGENKRERWNIEHRIFWGDPEKEEVWNELEDWLLTPYYVAGYPLKSSWSFIDAGYKSSEVYRFTKKRQKRRVFASMGSSTYFGPLVNKPKQVGKIRAMLYTLGVDSAKDSILLSSLEIDPIENPGPGAIHFPNDVDKEFFAQLCAEEKRIKYVRGQKYFYYHNLRERNEILDLHVGNLCAYEALNPNIAKIKARRDNRAQQPPDMQLRRTTQRPKRGRKKKNFVTDF